VREVDHSNLTQLRTLSSDASLEAVVSIVGDRTLGAGAWRFFGQQFPEGGIAAWNSPAAAWRLEWGESLLGLLTFGEDVFGNQLLFSPGAGPVRIWMHENGEVVNTELDLATIAEAAMQNGLGWLDPYADGSLDAAADFGLPAPTNHLHWQTPLVLGGSVEVANLTLVEREAHLMGHAKLWARIGGLPPGTHVVVR